jgi:peroxiredoxin
MQTIGFRTSSLLALALGITLLVDRAVAGEPTPPPAKLGKKIGNVTFKDAAGKTFALHDLKNKKAVVVVFLSFDCPVSTNYSPVLIELTKQYEKRGVAFLGVTTNLDEDAAQVAKHAKEFKLTFPVYRDDKLAAANALKADITPEAFVLDHNFVLRYRGRIDNGYAARLKKNQQVTRHDLRQALDELLADKEVSVPVTEAIGCTIEREPKVVANKGKVTYYRDVLPILQNHCQSCHRPGEVGPFSLMTYRQAVNWALDIKEYTKSRTMPPWKPAEGMPFHNERKLSDKEIAALAAWVDNGTPEGNRKDAPPPRKFPEGWQLGQPDLVLTLSEDFQVGAKGRDLFRCFVLPTNLTEDKYVAAIEVRPSNPRVVHHVLMFVDTEKEGRKLEKKQKDIPLKETDQDRGPGYSVAMGVGFFPKRGLSGWAPGQVPRYLPDGVGYPLPKGSDVVMQVHYHRNGRVEKDRTSVGLYFAKKPVTHPFQGSVIAGGRGTDNPLGMFFIIPAGAEHFYLKGSSTALADCTLFSVMPHMHLIGKQIKVTMTPPGGATKTLVNIKDWDYNWQETYFFKQPIQVKTGTRFDVEAFYDNSANNPNNPFNPPRSITFGEQTTNEMCFVFLGGMSNLAQRGLPIRPKGLDKLKKPAESK